MRSEVRRILAGRVVLVQEHQKRCSPLDFSLEESPQGRFQRQVKSPYSADAAFNRAKGVRGPGESNRALLAFVLVIML